MATMAYAERKLEKWGGPVLGGRRPMVITAQNGEYIIEVTADSSNDEVASVRLLHETECDDHSLDYCAGTWCDTVRAAITMADVLGRTKKSEKN